MKTRIKTASLLFFVTPSIWQHTLKLISVLDIWVERHLYLEYIGMGLAIVSTIKPIKIFWKWFLTLLPLFHFCFPRHVCLRPISIHSVPPPPLSSSIPTALYKEPTDFTAINTFRVNFWVNFSGDFQVNFFGELFWWTFWVNL